MNKEIFNIILDKLFKEYKEPKHFNTKILSLYTKKEVEELNDYIINNYKDNITIEVYGYKIINDDIILMTELGSFVLESYQENYSYFNHEKKYYDYETLDNFVGKKYNLLDFFKKLFKNDLNFQVSKYHYNEKPIIDEKNPQIFKNNILLFDYLKAYFIYRMLKDKQHAKRLFHSVNEFYFGGTKVRYIPLEYLNNEEFNNFIFTKPDEYLTTQRLIYLYDNYYKFNNNIKLLFACIIISKEYSKINIIKNNMEEFKKFIFEEGIQKAFNNKYAKYTLEFLKESKLIDELTIEEKILLYKTNPETYYKVFPENYLEIANKITNNSPLIRLNNKEEKMVHIQYQNHNLYENIPIISIRRQNTKIDAPFFLRFIYQNESVVKFYKAYYKSYKQAISSKPEKDNLEDFIKNLLYPKNLIKIFENNNFTWQDIENLITFKKYYNENISKLIEETKENYRQKTLIIYKDIINTNNKNNNMDECLKKYNLNKDNIYEYIINNKFYFSDEKNIMINILNKYYNQIRVLDILLILDEMLTRELTIDEILEEKNIPKKAFQSMYNSAKENNPILYNCIFTSLNKNKRRGYIKLIKLGYIVLKTELSSLEDYNQKFKDIISFTDLLDKLKETSLYEKLLEKSSQWKDFDKEQTIKIKQKKLKEV